MPGSLFRIVLGADPWTPVETLPRCRSVARVGRSQVGRSRSHSPDSLDRGGRRKEDEPRASSVAAPTLSLLLRLPARVGRGWDRKSGTGDRALLRRRNKPARTLDQAGRLDLKDQPRPRAVYERPRNHTYF